MIEVKGKGGISAKIIADSICPRGKRVTTYELNYPRFIHSEFMTHRLFSRNAASSRAIPVPKMIENIKANTAMPIHWGAHQKGMQADAECENTISDGGWDFTRESWWEIARDEAIYAAEEFHAAGYHKQIINRLLEPFQFIKVVCTATSFDNFFWLRSHKDAQPEIRELSDCMYNARLDSLPNFLSYGEWHLPYVDTRGGDLGIEYIVDNVGVSLEDALKVSSSCCAQVSYRLTDNSLEKAEMIYKMLVEAEPVHASPIEHQCYPMDEETQLDSEGVTGYNNSLGHYSGNFFGWVQHRQLIPENTCWNYEAI